VGRAIPVRRVRFPSTSANYRRPWPAGQPTIAGPEGPAGQPIFAGPEGPAGRAGYAVEMKKLILLVMLVALGVVAAKKVRSA
jgi:hypothetical protein